MPNRSPLLFGIIEDAESHYLMAQQTLSSSLSNQDPNSLHRIDERDEIASSPTESSIRHSLSSQTSSTSTAATSISGSHSDSPENSSWEDSPSKKSSPLQVRKYSMLPQTPAKQITESTSLFSIAMASNRRSPQSFSSSLLLTPNDSPEKSEPSFVYKYNEDLNEFAQMLANHVTSIQSFRHAAEAAHDVWRPASQNGTGTKEMDIEEKTIRIARGKERGWARPRFNAQRYQDLCEKAIAEL
jgi:hypothetical protein